MVLHKWLIRSWVFMIFLFMAGIVICYQIWTNPSAVRDQVIHHMEAKFPGVDVTLESARLRILGGILLTDLRLFRRDDKTRTDVAYIPSGVVYHDKEHILDGKLRFRKVELHRPRLHVHRDAEGHWNILGLTGPADFSKVLPTMVIHDGHVIFRDENSGPRIPSFELTDVHMSIINDPVLIMNFEGEGVSTKLGAVRIKGRFHRESEKLDVRIRFNAMAISEETVRQFLQSCSIANLEEMKAEGKADVEIVVSFSPQQPNALEYQSYFHVYEGKLEHPKLPLRFHDIDMQGQCINGDLSISQLTGHSGKTRLDLQGSTSLPCVTEEFVGSIALENLSVTEELFDSLPKEAKKIYETFEPQGIMHCSLQAEKKLGEWTKKELLIRPTGMNVCFKHFPYKIGNVNGVLQADLLQHRVDVNLESSENGRIVSVLGKYHGNGPNAEVDLQLKGNNIALDDKIRLALKDNLQDLAQSFHPTGKADVNARIYRPLGHTEFANEFRIRFSDATVCWDNFPYKIDKVNGLLNVFPGYWEFSNFRGRHGAGKVLVSGRSFPTDAGGDSTNQRILIDIAGENIGIDEDLREALTPIPNLGKAWDAMVPGGSLNFKAKVDRIPGRPQDLDIAVNVAGCRVKPSFFPCQFTDVNGRFRYHGNRLEMTEVQGKHNESVITIPKGTVDISPTGGFYVDLKEVVGNPVLPSPSLANALPEQLRNILTTMQLKAPMAVKSRIVISKSEIPGTMPDVYWDSRVWFREPTLQLGVPLEDVTGTFACVGRHDGQKLLGLSGNVLMDNAKLFKQPFSKVYAHVQIEPDTPDTMLVNLKAPIFAGDISGQARLEFHSTMRYEVNLTASQIDLEKFGKHNLGKNMEMGGLASGRLHLTGRGDSMESLKGNGTLDVPKGRIYNLPLLLDILKFLGLRWPDRTAFEEAHANFSIDGNSLNINQVFLWGNAVSLTGKGSVNLDGTDIEIDCYPSWARVEQILPATLRSMSPAISKNLLKIELRGKISDRSEDLKMYKRPIPVLVDPLRELQNRFAIKRPDRESSSNLKILPVGLQWDRLGN